MASCGIQQRLCHNDVVHFEMDTLQPRQRRDVLIDKVENTGVNREPHALARAVLLTHPHGTTIALSMP
jgi:hypothetical protein